MSDLFGEELARAPLIGLTAPIVKQLQGQEANHSGSFLEEMILREFQRRGVNPLPFDENNKDFINPRRLLRGAPYRSLYGTRSVSEFLYIDDTTGHAVRIECRWQEQHGSVDEKFPYLFVNARDRMPERTVWLVIGGDGARKAALAWIKREAKCVTAKTILILTPGEAKIAIKQLLR